MAKKEGAKVQESQRVELPTAKELMKQIAQKEPRRLLNTCATRPQAKPRKKL